MRNVAVLAMFLPAVLVPIASARPESRRPLRILIVSGGGYHDYAWQRNILEKGVKARLNVQVSHSFSDPAGKQVGNVDRQQVRLALGQPAARPVRFCRIADGTPPLSQCGRGG